MDTQIICPNCNKSISNHPVIEAAIRKDYSEATPISCECGKNITFWTITAQLRDQNTRGQRFKNWIQNIFIN